MVCPCRVSTIMLDFNCFICTEDRPSCQLVRFVACGHEICLSCCETIIRAAYDHGDLPTCPFCSQEFFWIPLHAMDEMILDSLYSQGIQTSAQDEGCTLIHTCYNPNCTEYLRINGHCHCPFIVHYAFFPDNDPTEFLFM